MVRSYYHCRACGKGHVPWERTLGLSDQRLTPAASEVVSMLGVQSSFAEVSERTLQKACGLRLSESTVERVTEGAGERLRKLLAERVKFGKPEQWDWERDAAGRQTSTRTGHGGSDVLDPKRGRIVRRQPWLVQLARICNRAQVG